MISRYKQIGLSLAVLILGFTMTAAGDKTADSKTTGTTIIRTASGTTMTSSSIKLHVLPSIGTSCSSANYHINGTGGQAAIGRSESSGYNARGGFWEAVLGVSTGDACCMGAAGNVNADPDDKVDVSDLTLMVNHLFVTFQQLPCPAEANVNGDEGCKVDVSDLTYLVNTLFITFTQPQPCLPACE